jgi:tetratricopeptide (TPR) repeat protein
MQRLLALLLLLAAFPLLAQEETPEVARSLMEEAAQAREGKRIDEAIAKYAKVIEVAPSLASAYINLGALYFGKGEVDKAYATFVQGVEHAPADRTLLSNAAATAQQLGKSAAALTYVDRAIEKNRRDAGLLSLRGTILRALNRNDEALAALQQASQLAPDDAKVQFSLGNQLYALGRKDEAINAYGRAAALDKTFIRAYYNLGAVLFESGRYDDALQAYKVALAPVEQAFAKHETVDPIHARAYANLGAIYIRQQQWPLAADAYEKSLRLDPANTAAHYNLGFIFFTTNQPQRAEEEYRKVMAADAALPLTYLHLGTLAYRKGDYDKAAQLLRDGLPRYDADSKPAALRLLARAELARGRRDDARKALEQALAMKADDTESLLMLARLQRQSGALADARATLARVTAPNNLATMERLLVAKGENDLTAERTAIEELLARDPKRSEPLRAELAAVQLRQGDVEAARRMGGPFMAAVSDALAGRRDAAARALAQLGTPLARGDAGLLFWQLGRTTDAKAHLAAARAAYSDWSEVALAAGEIALAERRYDDAADLLAGVKCDESTFGGASGNMVLFTLGRSDDVCARAKSSLTTTLLSAAAQALSAGSPRQARALLERAGDTANRSVVTYLRGRIDLASGDDGGRDLISRAVSLGLPPSLETLARRDLEATEPMGAEAAPAEPSSAAPHRTVVVFLPDAPAENEKKLAEAMNALVAQWGAAAGVPLSAELFRRADDARTFVLTNRDKVGIVIASPDFARNVELTPKFQFTHSGGTSYRRVVVVPTRSNARSLADLKSRTISAVEGLGDAGVTVTTHVPDDLTALANALYGKTDAALVNEDNPLLAQHTRELRVIHTTAPAPLPVFAFGAMPAADRAALYDAAPATAARALAPLQMAGVTRLDRPAEPARKRELAPLIAANLGLPRPPDPPQNLALRAAVNVPAVAINEDLFGRP